MSLRKLVVLALLPITLLGQAQAVPVTAGTVVAVCATGVITLPNDQATVTFEVTEQHKDPAVAASRVNQKMNTGAEIVRSLDPKATLRTKEYSTEPVYAEDEVMLSSRNKTRGEAKPPEPVAWRVVQQLEVKTSTVRGLSKMTAALQSVLALNGIRFGLSPETSRQLDDKRIAVSYQNLNQRIAAIATAMGRSVSDATLESVDVDGAGTIGPVGALGGKADWADGGSDGYVAFARSRGNAVAEPKFEPGETTISMRIVGKVRFK